MNQLKKFGLPALLLFILAAAGYFHLPRVMIPFEEQLTSPDDNLRNLAYYKFLRLDRDEWPQFVDSFEKLAVDSDKPFTRRFALYLLRIIAPQDPALDALVLDSLEDESARVREEAAVSVLRRAPRILPEILNRFNRFSPSIQKHIWDSLVRRGEELIPVVNELISLDNYQFKYLGAKLVYEAGDINKITYGGLKKNLNSTEPAVRLYSALALNKIDPDDKHTLDIYRQVLKEEKWDNRQYSVLDTLKGMKKSGGKLFGDLSEQLVRRPDGFARPQYPKPEIAKAMNAIKPRSQTLEGLQNDLKQKDPTKRYRAVVSISELNEIALVHSEGLVRAAGDIDPYVGARAIYSLNKMGIEKATRFHQDMAQAIAATYSHRIDLVEGYEDLISEPLRITFSKVIPLVFTLVQNKALSLSHADRLIRGIPVDSLEVLEPYLSYKQKEIRAIAAINLFRRNKQSEEIKKILIESRGLTDGQFKAEIERAIAVQ